jgi:hypothetical protein
VNHLKTIEKYWEEKPLVVILFIAAFFRLIAVIFSKGYGMHDDHFIVIEIAQSWVDNKDYNNWLPSSANLDKPSGHSLLYPGLHYILFSVLEFLGMKDPQSKMYIVRFIHACWSMIIVYVGYKIALRTSGIQAAKMAGLLLACLFFMPMMSVRNLVEFACIPSLIIATWIVIKEENKNKIWPFVLAGIMFSISFSTRFQTSIFIGGFGLALLILKKWKETLWVCLGFLSGLILIQSTTDMLIWKKPFVELMEYVRYNLENSKEYPNLPWYTYTLLIGGILVPSISLLIIFGFLRSWKKHLLLFLPAFLFFIFHSSFPNKQERFILPAIPFIVILGCIGWCNFMLETKFLERHAKFYRTCWIVFFSLNTIPLIFVSAAYSHRNRVESMVYLSKKPDVNNVMVEESNHSYYTVIPHFYLKQWKSDYFVTSVFTVDSMAVRIRNSPPELIPNYIVFNQPENMDARIQNMKRLFPDLTYEATIEPGFIDRVMHFLNKHNANFTSYIYRTKK